MCRSAIRHGEKGNQCCAPALQEKVDHQHHKPGVLLGQRERNFHARRHGRRRIQTHRVGEVMGELLPQFLQPRAYAICSVDRI